MRRDVVVVGGGAMGSATSWQLARRGREVTLLERFGERHDQGASHGGADPDDVGPISCTYTSTDDGTFVLDAVGPLVVGAGFSGHGFKFVPTVGRILADLVEGISRPPALFSFPRIGVPPRHW